MRVASHIQGLALFASGTLAQVQSTWGQCGGQSYIGVTRCPQGTYCNYGNPWYSQCIPPEQQQPQPGVPDSPIVTQTVTTIFTIVPGPDPILVTTFFSFLTPSPTPTPTRPAYTVIDGTTWIIIPGHRKRAGPATAQLAARVPEPTAPARLLHTDETEAERRDVGRSPVYDAPLAPRVVRAVEKRDVERPAVYDTPLEAGVSRKVPRAAAVRGRDVDRPAVYDSPLAPGFVRTAPAPAERRDADRAPVYDAPLAAGFVRKVKPAKRDVDRPPVYDAPIARGFEPEAELGSV